MAPITTKAITIEMFVKKHAKGRLMPTHIEQRAKP
jgi:hypothetical protein